MYLLLFLASVSSVAKLLPVWLLTAAVVVCVLAADRRVLRRVDWSLLLTFAAFFVFIGNMGRVPAFRSLLEQAISGHEPDHGRVRQPGHQQRARRRAGPLRLPPLGAGMP